MSAAAVLHRLHDAGVEVVYDAPDGIRLRGPLTDELVAAARAVKPELLELARPRPAVHACTCCGRFYFAEPAVVCFWCRPRKHPDKTDRSPPEATQHQTAAALPQIQPPMTEVTKSPAPPVNGRTSVTTGVTSVTPPEELENPGATGGNGTSVTSVREDSKASPRTRDCPSCGGGMHHTDADGDVCHACRHTPERTEP